jgi:hypothetical protein
MLHALGAVSGRLLRYDQAVDTRGLRGVTFASAVFEDERE